MTIVIAEDNNALNFAIKLLLEKHGHTVTAFTDGTALIETVGEKHVDLFILDINLPGADGFEIMEALTPYFDKSNFIFISSYTDMERISKAFALGCEDYLKKPFEIEELLIRVQKVASRCVVSGTMVLDEYCSFNVDDRLLEVEGKSIDLTDKENKIMQLLVENRGHIVSYDLLSEYIWDESVPQNTIAAVVRRLRKKMGSELIQSVREQGYRLLK